MYRCVAGSLQRGFGIWHQRTIDRSIGDRGSVNRLGDWSFRGVEHWQHLPQSIAMAKGQPSRSQTIIDYRRQYSLKILIPDYQFYPLR
jgi:hypothetical protein